jgi:hypothetical protein
MGGRVWGGEPVVARLSRLTWRFFGAGILFFSMGCSALSREEAREALEEAQFYSEAVSLIGGTVDLSENFSIGQAVNASAENLRDFYATQLPCASVDSDENSVTVEYGAEGDDCEHRGMTFTGTHRVTVEVNEDDEVQVHHAWTELQNGKIEVSGTAVVTWSGGEDPSRRVVHDLAWKRLSDGREAEGRGDRVQQPLDGNIVEGFTVTGDAMWAGESGRYDLRISDVEMRWVDPVPQRGKYILETPFDARLTLQFNRSDPRTVDVVVKSGRRQFEFEVITPP